MIIRDWIFQFLRMGLLALTQVLIISQFNLHNLVNPFIYPLFVLLMPVRMPQAAQLTMGFLMGFLVDVFMSTQGMHTMATLTMSYLRIIYLQRSLGFEQLNTIHQPDIANTGLRWFIFYSLILTFLHHFVLFFAEVFSFHEFFFTISKIIISTITSMLLMFCLHLLFFKIRNKDSKL